MLDARVAAALEDVERAGHVARDVGVRVFDRIAHSRLRGEVHDALELLAREERRDADFESARSSFTKRKLACLREALEARLLQCDVVIFVQVVEADDLVAPLEQALRGVRRR